MEEEGIKLVARASERAVCGRTRGETCLNKYIRNL